MLLIIVVIKIRQGPSLTALKSVHSFNQFFIALNFCTDRITNFVIQILLLMVALSCWHTSTTSPRSFTLLNQCNYSVLLRLGELPEAPFIWPTFSCLPFEKSCLKNDIFIKIYIGFLDRKDAQTVLEITWTCRTDRGKRAEKWTEFKKFELSNGQIESSMSGRLSGEFTERKLKLLNAKNCAQLKHLLPVQTKIIRAFQHVLKLEFLKIFFTHRPKFTGLIIADSNRCLWSAAVLFVQKELQNSQIWLWKAFKVSDSITLSKLDSKIRI